MALNKEQMDKARDTHRAAELVLADLWTRARPGQPRLINTGSEHTEKEIWRIELTDDEMLSISKTYKNFWEFITVTDGKVFVGRPGIYKIEFIRFTNGSPEGPRPEIDRKDLGSNGRMVCIFLNNPVK